MMSEAELCRGWMEAVGRAEVRGALEMVYARGAEEIARRGPVCWASGRCCNFEKAKHRLYVTGLEAAYLVRGLESANVQACESARVGEKEGGGARTLVQLTRGSLDAAIARGGCPFQEGNLCGVHGIKPVGCRVYFCDRTARVWQEELSESLLGEVRGIHERYGVEYRYAEWRAVLGWFVG